MVASSGHISLQKLSLDELSGVVTLYPWFAAARMELCRRMFQLGENAWSLEEFAAQALYVPDRSKFAELLRSGKVQSLKDSPAPAEEAPLKQEEAPLVRAVGGDYFTQAQYDAVRQGGEKVFSRLAMRDRPETAVPVEDTPAEIADRFSTETLADIFLEQGCYQQARRIYSRLMLDIPEKSAYFASLIEKIDSIE